MDRPEPASKLHKKANCTRRLRSAFQALNRSNPAVLAFGVVSAHAGKCSKHTHKSAHRTFVLLVVCVLAASSHSSAAVVWIGLSVRSRRRGRSWRCRAASRAVSVGSTAWPRARTCGLHGNDAIRVKVVPCKKGCALQGSFHAGTKAQPQAERAHWYRRRTAKQGRRLGLAYVCAHRGSTV